MAIFSFIASSPVLVICLQPPCRLQGNRKTKIPTSLWGALDLDILAPLEICYGKYLPSPELGRWIPDEAPETMLTSVQQTLF